MKNNDFYLGLNILNIILCLCIYITFLVCFIIFSIAENSFIPICYVLLCIFAKIFLLHVLFIIFEKFFPNLILSEVAKELKTNTKSRKHSLLLAFAYDVVIMLFDLLFFSLKEYGFEWTYIPVYEILTLGGVCMFYISLFGIWKMQDKFKKITPKKQFN